MAVRTLDPAAITDSDLARWRRLAEKAIEPNPFYSPEALLPAARHLGVREVELIVVDDGDEWAACMPARRARGWRRMPTRGTAVWRHRYCFLGVPLVASGAAPGVLRAAIDACLDHRSNFVGMEMVPADGPFLALVAESLGEEGKGWLAAAEHERAFLRAGDEKAIGLSAKHRRNFERLLRRLGEQMGSEVELRDRAGDEDAVEQFLRLEAQGWKGHAGTAFASIPGHDDFFRSLCRGFAERGELELLSLEAGGEPVAIQANLRAGEGRFCFKLAVDERWHAFSPGVQLELEMSRRFLRTAGGGWMDSCAAPDNEMINRLWPGRRRLVTLVVAPRGARGRLTRGMVAGLNAAKPLRRAARAR